MYIIYLALHFANPSAMLKLSSRARFYLPAQAGNIYFLKFHQ